MTTALRIIAGLHKYLRWLNRLGKKWSGLITLNHMCNWVVGLTLMALTLWQTVQTRWDVELSQKALERSIGLQIVSRGETLDCKTTVKTSFDCAYYWVLFSHGDFVWPQVGIKNTRQPNQLIDVSVTVPQKFCSGELIVVGVSDKVHEKFNEWLKKGEDAALLKPEDMKVIFCKSLMTREGGFQ